jgi:SAM-dependent methyltransferase
VSRARLEEHRRLWADKPVLARVYARWFELLLAEAPRGGRVVEVGAGPGTLRAFARATRPDLAWLATDIEPLPWNHVAADASRLPVRDASARTIVGLDVLHHLSDPRAFFADAARALAPGGRLALVEPWISPLSWVVYRFFHEEDCRLSVDPWRPFPPGKAGFDGDAALSWRIVGVAGEADWRQLGLSPPRVQRLNAFAYLMTLGFRRASLLPSGVASAAMAIDRWTEPLARLAAMRALVVWEKP